MEFFQALGEVIGALDEGDETPFALNLDLTPWGGQMLSVSNSS